MNLLHQGGWMMWPLLAVSIAVGTIILERCLLLFSLGFPSAASGKSLENALREGSTAPLVAALPATPLFAPFAVALSYTGANREQEALLQVAGEGIVQSLSLRLGTLGVLARIAPLMGLLGTIFGMITTFSRLAQAQSGVDMDILAGGIWQALLTTAAGLIIAIPALLAHYWFMARCRQVALALEQTGRVALALRADQL